MHLPSFLENFTGSTAMMGVPFGGLFRKHLVLSEMDSAAERGKEKSENPGNEKKFMLE